MHFDGLPLRILIFFLIALSCPISGALADVSHETIDRLAQINVERGEIRHLNLIGKLTDQEHYARTKTLNTEAATLWELIPRQERNAAQSAITGLSRSKLSLKEPGWRKEEEAYREARDNLRQETMRDADKSAKEAAQIQKQRQSLQAELDKGTLDRATFDQKDAEALAAIAALRNKNDPTGRGRPGYYFDERLTFYTSRMNEPPKPPAPRPVAKPPVVIYRPPPPPPDFTFIYAIGGGALFIGLLWLISRVQKEEPQGGTSVTDIHGSAHWTPHHYQPAAHSSVARGVTFGKSSAPGYHLKAPGAPVTSLPENHVLVIAKSGAGKGTRVIYPTLLRYASSVCVVDPKGENAAVTARTRRDQLGQDIQILNPWGVLKDHYTKMGFQTATYNPLDMLDRNDPNITSLAKTLAATISPVTDGKSAFWEGMAARILTGTFLWLTDQEGLPRYDDPSQPETKTLARVAELVNLPKPEFQKFLARLLASKAFHGDIRQQVGQMGDSGAADTYGGIMLHLQGRTDFIDTPLKISTASSSISFTKLADGTLTVYLVIPFDYIKTHGTWLRLIISAATKAITTARQKHPEKPLHRCMFLIDEFGSIGYIPAIAADLAQLRGYGIDFTLILQNLGQLKDHYKDAEDNILGSCGYKYFCWIKDLHTQKILSESLGKKTVQTVGTSQSTGATQAGQTEGTSTTYGETGRNLLNPDEIDRLDKDTAILLQPYGAPHYLHTIDYRELTTAYAHLKDSHPELYWNPPLTYDANPYYNKPPSPPHTLFPDLKNLPPIVPPPAEFFTPPPPKTPPKTLEDFVSKESLDEFKRAIRERGGFFPLPTPPPEPPASKPTGINWAAVFPEDDPTQPPPKPPRPPEPPKPPKVTPGTLGEDVFDEDDEWQPPDDPHDPDDDDDPPDPGEPQTAQGR